MGVSATTGVGFVADLPSMSVYVEEESSASGPSVGPRLKIHWNPNPAFAYSWQNAFCVFISGLRSGIRAVSYKSWGFLVSSSVIGSDMFINFASDVIVWTFYAFCYLFVGRNLGFCCYFLCGWLIQTFSYSWNLPKFFIRRSLGTVIIFTLETWKKWHMINYMFDGRQIVFVSAAEL